MNFRELLQPQFEEFQNMCVQLKADEIIQCIVELKANGMNLSAFDDCSSKKRFIKTFTTTGVFGASGWAVEVDNDSAKKVLKSEQWRISKECEKYAEKLEQKVHHELMGDRVVSVTLEGNLWKHSCMKVTGASGNVVMLETKTIINKSKYGDCFFQFPTRVKRES